MTPRLNLCVLTLLAACVQGPPDPVFDPEVKNGGHGTIVGNPGMISGRGSFRLAAAHVSPAAQANLQIIGLQMTSCDKEDPTVHQRAMDRTIDLSDQPRWPITAGLWCAMDILLQPPVVIRQTPRVGVGLDIELDVAAISLSSEEPFKVYADGEYVIELGQFGWLDSVRDAVEDGSAHIRPGEPVHDELVSQISEQSALYDSLAEARLSGVRSLAAGADRE